mgnify:CR=1 FL=1
MLQIGRFKELMHGTYYYLQEQLKTNHLLLELTEVDMMMKIILITQGTQG